MFIREAGPGAKNEDKKLPKDYGFSDTKTILGINSAFGNLFEIIIMPSEGNTLANKFPVRNIKGIVIDSLGIDLKRDFLTRKYKADTSSLIYYGPIQISWLEDEEFTVATFHKKWREAYYNEEKQVWVSGTTDKFVSLKLKIHTNTANILSPYGNNPNTNQLVIELRNISLPKKMPAFKLQYDKADQIDYDLSYPVEQILTKTELDVVNRNNPRYLAGDI